tara:strand:- start:109 stop:360 length:252 start_codon:yes stop_codon:yes gene_type:complete
MSEVKFTEEELKQVQDIQQDYLSIQNQFGQLKLAILKLKQQESDLENSFKIIEDKEKNFLESVTKKYGDGTLNPETGLFTPNK